MASPLDRPSDFCALITLEFQDSKSQPVTVSEERTGSAISTSTMEGKGRTVYEYEEKSEYRRRGDGYQGRIQVEEEKQKVIQESTPRRKDWMEESHTTETWSSRGSGTGARTWSRGEDKKLGSRSDVTSPSSAGGQRERATTTESWITTGKGVSPPKRTQDTPGSMTVVVKDEQWSGGIHESESWDTTRRRLHSPTAEQTILIRDRDVDGEVKVPTRSYEDRKPTWTVTKSTRSETDSRQFGAVSEQSSRTEKGDRTDRLYGTERTQRSTTDRRDRTSTDDELGVRRSPPRTPVSTPTTVSGVTHYTPYSERRREADETTTTTATTTTTTTRTSVGAKRSIHTNLCHPKYAFGLCGIIRVRCKAAFVVQTAGAHQPSQYAMHN
ncbi:hypothetical protein AB6A40_006762 [Gnathostoma spinigerum]|uniref:Uncharacterized protein n=1 Tax=Gnathostoma spinigerum TaxID=75299 RepID=A0ABD6ESP5_9BILA